MFLVWGDDVVGAVARFGIQFRLASGSRPLKFAEYLFLMYFGNATVGLGCGFRLLARNFTSVSVFCSGDTRSFLWV